MKKKYYPAVFFDIDGTLYDHESNCIPALHMKMLKELQEKGTKVCLCTARALPLIENLGILHVFPWDLIVAGNGSYIYNEKMQLIYENCIDPTSAKQVFELAKKENASLFVAGNTAFTTDLSPKVQKILDDNHVRPLPVRTMKEQDRFCVMSYIVDNPTERRESLEAIAGIHPIYSRASIDIIKEGLSKYHGVQLAMQYMGLDEHNYMAFGDGASDLEMLENASFAAAMEDGDPILLNKIHNHCPNAHKAGIYTYLKEEGIL